MRCGARRRAHPSNLAIAAQPWPATMGHDRSRRVPRSSLPGRACVLAGRKVVVVGGGHVAQRRVPGLILAVDADVTVVSPEVTPALEGLAQRDHPRAARLRGRRPRGGVVRHRRHRRPRGQRAGRPRPPSGAASSASAPTTPGRPPRGRRRSAGTAASPSPCSATGSPASRRPCATTSSRAARRAPDRRTARTTARPAWCSSAAVPATRSWSPSPPGTPSRRPTSWSPTGWRRASCSTSSAPDVELIDVAKLPRGRSASQEEINEVIVERARAGKRVVRFKGGDNFVFGRGFEEVLACAAAGVPVTVVPGLTSRDRRPGPRRHPRHPPRRRPRVHRRLRPPAAGPPRLPGRLGRAGPAARHLVVLLMAVENAPAIAAALVAGGRPAGTPVAVVVDGTMPTERTVLSHPGHPGRGPRGPGGAAAGDHRDRRGGRGGASRHSYG